MAWGMQWSGGFSQTNRDYVPGQIYHLAAVPSHSTTNATSRRVVETDDRSWMDIALS